MTGNTSQSDASIVEPEPSEPVSNPPDREEGEAIDLPLEPGDANAQPGA